MAFLLAVAALYSEGAPWAPGPPPPIAPYGRSALPRSWKVVPMVFPVIGRVRYNRASYDDDRGTHRHTGIDIGAAKLSPVVAPIDGRLGFKNQTFWIYGDRGFAVLGTHLNNDQPGQNDNRGTRDLMFAPHLVSGQRIRRGELIGYVGDSGQSSGPHLHFELFQTQVGQRPVLANPWASLKRSQVRTVPVAPSIGGPGPQRGEMRFDGCIRRIDRSRREITLVLVAKQRFGEPLRAVTGPRYLRIKVPTSVLQENGGWARYAGPPTQIVTAYVVPSQPMPTLRRVRVSPKLQGS